VLTGTFWLVGAMANGAVQRFIVGTRASLVLTMFVFRPRDWARSPQGVCVSCPLGGNCSFGEATSA
jgi:hypothetical protein